MEEFAEQGYEHASTNKIVKAAEISKGTLFYYFSSKKELYCYLIDYCLEYIENSYLTQLQDPPTDFFEIYCYLSKIKLKSFKKNPELFHFTKRIYLDLNDDSIGKEKVERMIKIRYEIIGSIFAKTDTSKFREDIPKEKLLLLVKYSMDGYEQMLINRISEMGTDNEKFVALWDEYDSFLEVLKLLIYK